MPADLMLQSMTEAELSRWAEHARRHSLPYRRLEIMLAQLSTVVARSAGAKNVNVSDFMLKEAEDMPPPDNVVSIEEARQAFGFKPRVKKVI